MNRSSTSGVMIPTDSQDFDSRMDSEDVSIALDEALSTAFQSMSRHTTTRLRIMLFKSFQHVSTLFNDVGRVSPWQSIIVNHSNIYI